MIASLTIVVPVYNSERLLRDLAARLHPVLADTIPKILGRLRLGDCDVVYGTPRALPHSVVRNLLSRFTKGTLASAMGIRNFAI